MAENGKRVSNLDNVGVTSSTGSGTRVTGRPVRESVFVPGTTESTVKAPRLSYAVTKSFVKNSRVTRTFEEEAWLAETQQGLQISGDVNIISRVEGTQDILCVSYTETCEFIAAGLSDGTVRLVKVSTGEYTSSLRDPELRQNPGPTTSIKHRAVHSTHPITQTILTTYGNGCVKSWHYPTRQCLYTIREKRQTLDVAYHPQLPKFVTVGDDGNVCLYDEETKTQERIFHSRDEQDVTKGRSSRIFCACFNPKSVHEIISGGWDDTVQFWDTRQPYALRQIPGVYICGKGLDISRNGKEILTCSWTKKDALQLWDYGTGKLIVTLEPDSCSSKLYAGKYIENLFVASGGSDTNLFRIVDLRSHSTLASLWNLPGPVHDLDVASLPLKRDKRPKLLEFPQLPKIAFCCGKTIFEVDVG